MTCVAIIPAYLAEGTLTATLSSLRLGNGAFVQRVVVVTGQADPTAQVVRQWMRHDSRVELVTSRGRLGAGAARNGGREHVRRTTPSTENPLLLFVDADVRLEAGGAEALARESEYGGRGVVTARILGEGDWVARCRHILEFKEAASSRAAPSFWLPPSTVMLCPGEVFDRIGGFSEFWPGEDLVFSQTLRDYGVRVWRSDDVLAVHQHPPGVVAMLLHQWRLGTTAATARRRCSLPGSVFARRPLLAPLLFPARALRIAIWQAREGGQAWFRSLILSPLLLMGLLVWTAGFTRESSARDAK